MTDLGEVGTALIPVYAPFHEALGPQLSLGALTASARAFNSGSLNSTFEIRRPESTTYMLDHLRDHRGPAVVLCSDYVWSTERNLELVRRAKQINPELLAVHGGPSCPKYEGAAASFMHDHRHEADVLVRGEGELVLCELLEALSAASMRLTKGAMSGVGSITFVDSSTGQLCRTEDGERIADLTTLPSPYLTGEFDLIDAGAWRNVLPIETNRGCPYGCTFCDWGSATMSRIRWFDLDRVAAEIMWIADRGHPALYIADANFGVSERDIEVARLCAAAFSSTGSPPHVVFCPAKNTTRHLVQIMDVLLGAGITVHAGLALQSTDPTTLAAVDRKNISTRRYIELARDFRQRGIPVIGELMFGLPGQTPESYKRDLQFMLDHEIQQRSWPTNAIPNSPMQHPDYVSEWGIATDSSGLVASTHSFDRDDLAAMRRLRHAEVVCERFGVFRHPLRFLQWEHNLKALDVIEELSLLDATDTEGRYPLLRSLIANFDVFPAPPVGWRSLYEEFHQFAIHQLGVHDSAALHTVLAVQRHLMPAPGRVFPDRIRLQHDYVAYYTEATQSLWRSGVPDRPSRALKQFGPGSLSVVGDPLGLCTSGPYVDVGSALKPDDSSETTPEGDFYSGDHSAYELLSPLTRHLLPVASAGVAAVRTASGGQSPRFISGGARTGGLAPSEVRYVGALLPDLVTSDLGGSLHLGHWDDADLHAPHNDLQAAQRRTTEVIIDLAQISARDVVLDIASGPGAVSGVLSFDRSQTIVGVELDPRLLRWESIAAKWRGERSTSIRGDASHLPIRSAAVDVAICIEAAQHFESRRHFFREAHRAVRPGGRLAMSDLTIDTSYAGADLDTGGLLDVLCDGFAPWPDVGASAADVVAAAEASGWRCNQLIDATANTIPTHKCAAPDGARPHTREFGAEEPGRVFSQLHQVGVLRPHYFLFERC